MPSSFTTNKSLEQPANGAYIDTWNVPVNADLGVIDQAFGGATSLNATSGSAVLTTTQYRSLILSIAGAMASSVTYTIPSGVGGQWIVRNTTTDSSGGPWTVTIISGGGGASVVVARASASIIYSDGTNIYLADSHPVGAAGSNTQIQYNGNGFLAASSSFTFDGTNVAINSGGLKFPDGSIQTTASVIPSGTSMLFYQAAAPTGWTQITSLNDYSLRVVSGSGGGYTGGNGVSSFFSGYNTVGSTTLTTSQIPSHSHGVNDPGHTHGSMNAAANPDTFNSSPFVPNRASIDTPFDWSAVTGISIQSTGGGGSHNHTIPNLAYADIIICTKS